LKRWEWGGINEERGEKNCDGWNNIKQRLGNNDIWMNSLI